MIAWESHIDRTRDDPDGLYRRLSAPVTFSDGASAAYGFGLVRGTMFGRAITRHSGALRGWLSQRLHMAAERLSVVVLFNHSANPGAAAEDLVAAALDTEQPKSDAELPAPTWLGTYVEPETGLAVRLSAKDRQTVLLRYGTGPEELTLQADGTANAKGTTLRPGSDGLVLEMSVDNQRSLLIPSSGPATMDIDGRYTCEELGADLTIIASGGAFYAACTGILGDGRMELLEPIGPDLWLMPCPRGIDHFPPGDWTLAFKRDASNRISGMQVGCWLARHLTYARAG
jgi:D-aminopeptidase